MPQQFRRFFMRMELRKKTDRTTRVLMTFFLAVIAVGTILMVLPASSADGQSCGFMTALFTATASVCVTGLSLVDTYTQWSPFGQVVLLLLIQTGGLGYMTLVSIMFFMLRKKIGLRERLILQQAMALKNARFAQGALWKAQGVFTEKAFRTPVDKQAGRKEKPSR